MGSDRRVALVLGLAALLGCKKPPPPSGDAGAQPATSVPPDRLAQDEVPPGQEKAHDLLLPRGAKIDRRYGVTIYTTVPLAPEAAANWVRNQSDDAQGIVGPTGTVFPKVHVRGADAGHALRIEIAHTARVDQSTMIVDRVEEVAPPLVPQSNEELWKKAGLTPDGKPLDPTHVE